MKKFLAAFLVLGLMMSAGVTIAHAAQSGNMATYLPPGEG